jgi:hypothetical protein
MAGAMQTRWLTISAVVLASACAGPRPATGLSYDSSVITEEEIENSGAVTAYDAIKKVHANFLSYRGPTTLNQTSSPEPTVYLDGQLFGLIGILKTIPSAQVAEIRLYRAWEATTRFGNGNMGGVIAITTRR